MTDLLAHHLADPLAAARAWKAQGGRVVGYLCDNVPEELIAAAGFLPLRVRGDAAADTRLVETLVDRLYTPEVTVRPPFVTAILARLLGRAYDVLDYLVVPHNRDAIQAIYRQLRDAGRRAPGLRLPELYYLDKAWTPGVVQQAFDRESVLLLKSALEDWAGRAITEADLDAALAAADENRRLLGQIQALRSARPARLSGVEALQLFGAASAMPKAEHNRMLKDVLASAGARPARAGVRVFVGGSPLDHTEVYSAIEAAGATIVAEDHCWGQRAFDPDPPGAADALERLIRRFQQRPACSIVFPMAEGARACARRAAVADVDAAIFYVMDEDWAQVWETPGQMRALEAAGIPCLHLRRQPYGADAQAIGEAVAGFLDGLPASAT